MGNKGKSRPGSAQKTAYIGVFTALAFIFSYIEAMLPFDFKIPGIKLGLANIVIINVLYTIGAGMAAALSVIRVVLAGFTFNNMAMMMYSLAGAVLSFIVMYILKRTNKFSVAGVSAAGGVAHNAGQLIMAFAMIGEAVFYYTPFLIISGTAAGIIIGITGAMTVKITERIFN